MLLSAPLIETSPPAMRDRRHAARPRLLAVAVAARRLAFGLQHARLAFVGRSAERLCRRRPCPGRARSRLVGSVRRPGPLGPHSPRGAREPRRADGRSARAGCACRRDDQPLVAGAERRRQRRGDRRQHRIRQRRQARPSRPQDGERGGERLVGDRPRRTAARRRLGGSGGHEGGRGQRARCSPPGDDRCCDQLLHARRRAAAARDRARDRRGAGRDAAPRFRTPARRSRDAVRRRARADRRIARARGDPAARDRGRDVAPSHRGAHRRPGVQRCEHRALDAATSSLRRPGRDSRPRCSSAGPTCSRSRRSSTRPMRAGSRPRPNGSRASSSALSSAARASS